mmetsp:Transcript_17540/g.40312  ORF Transcript_17540/g.40312 Transcript_17540/m.40312 type:complete len:307 (+) Transcript_17540:74-994(+)
MVEAASRGEHGGKAVNHLTLRIIIWQHALLDGAKGKHRSLRSRHDRRRALDSVHAQVHHGKGPALVLILSKGALHGTVRRKSDLVRDGFESLGANIFDDRGREAIPHPNQEIDVAPIVDPHKIFHPTSVHVGHGFHGEGRSLDHEVVDGEGLFLGQQLVKPRPGCQQRTELDVHGEIVVRYLLLGQRHPRSDLAARFGHRQVRKPIAKGGGRGLRQGRRSGRSRRSSRRSVARHVGRDNTILGTRRRNLADIKSLLTRHRPRKWGGEDSIPAPRRRGCSRGRWGHNKGGRCWCWCRRCRCRWCRCW